MSNQNLENIVTLATNYQSEAEKTIEDRRKKYTKCLEDQEETKKKIESYKAKNAEAEENDSINDALKYAEGIETEEKKLAYYKTKQEMLETEQRTMTEKAKYNEICEALEDALNEADVEVMKELKQLALKIKDISDNFNSAVDKVTDALETANNAYNNGIYVGLPLFDTNIFTEKFINSKEFDEYTR